MLQHHHLHTSPLPGRARHLSLSAPVCKRSVSRVTLAAATSVDAVASDAARASPTTSLSDAERSKLQTVRVTGFSAQQWVRDFLTEPLTSAFPNSSLIEAKLDNETAKLAQGSDVVVLFVNDRCNSKVIDVLADGGVKLIAMRCAGYDRVDLEAAQRRGIRVARVCSYSPESVAEHALALMFALNRKLHTAQQRTVAGNYSLSGLVGFEMCRKTVGVVGTGAIGVQACRMLKGLGMNVLAYDLRPNPAVTDMGIPYVSLDEMLPQADIVSLHVPLLPTTHHIINEARLKQMKHGAMLVNVSRGGLVQSDALFDALERGQLGALGLDVYEEEDSLFFVDYTMFETADRMKKWDRQFKALLTYPQVIVTPHLAFLTREALTSIATTTIDNITNFALGRDLGANEVIYKLPAKQ